MAAGFFGFQAFLFARLSRIAGDFESDIYGRLRTTSFLNNT